MSFLWIKSLNHLAERGPLRTFHFRFRADLFSRCSVKMGRGKTTAIKVLLGLLLPDSGSVSVLGLNPVRQDIELRRYVGYVPDIADFYEWMSVAEAGQLAASFYPLEYQPEFLRYLNDYEIDPHAKIKNLSKGQRALLSLTLALSNDPDLFILDEPTSGLDLVVRRHFYESMAQRSEFGKTVFISSHQVSEIERVATHIALMRKEKLVFVETMSKLHQTSATVDLDFEKMSDQTEIKKLGQALLGQLINIKGFHDQR